MIFQPPLPSDLEDKEGLKRPLSFVRRLGASLRPGSASPPETEKVESPANPIISDIDDWGHLLPDEFVQFLRQSGWEKESFAELFHKFKFTTPQKDLRIQELSAVRSTRAEKLMTIFNLKGDNIATADLLGEEKIRLPIRDGLSRVARIQEVRDYDLEEGNLPIETFLDEYTDLPEVTKRLMAQILEEVFSCHTICDVYILGVENLEVKHPGNHEFSHLYRKQLEIIIEHTHWFLRHNTSYVPLAAKQATLAHKRVQDEPDDESEPKRPSGDVYNGEVHIDQGNHGVGCLAKATQLLVFGLLFSGAVVWTGSKADLWKINWSKVQTLFEPNSDQNRGLPVAFPVAFPSEVVPDEEAPVLPSQVDPDTGMTIVPLPKNTDKGKK